ncbi:MAG: peptidylprolyl isomerase [Desulfovibrionaceae bacterium]
MSTPSNGDTVTVKYIGTMTDGTVFDASPDDSPLQFVVGEGSIIPGFENAVLTMVVGDSKTVHIPANEAYGDRYDEMVFEVPLKELPSEIEPQAGMMLQAVGEGGQVNHFTITEITEDAAVLDGNHPLAGKDLTFEITLLSIG